MRQLRLQLDSSSGVPFYRQIIDHILVSLADGRLKPGSKLPTVRQLAVDLSVNLNTVAKAYREMEIRGIVETQQGTGTFIAAKPAERGAAEKRKALADLVERTMSNAASMGVDPADLVDALIERVEKAGRRP